MTADVVIEFLEDTEVFNYNKTFIKLEVRTISDIIQLKMRPLSMFPRKGFPSTLSVYHMDLLL